MFNNAGNAVQLQPLSSVQCKGLQYPFSLGYNQQQQPWAKGKN